MNNFSFFLCIKRMSEKTLKFNYIRVNKKELHKSKQPIDLMSVNLDQIIVSDKFKHSDEGFKYFIGYQECEIVKPSCIILPQMSEYMKYFENGGKNMSFLIKDDEVWEKYEQIWDVIKNKPSFKFHSKPTYDQKYLKAKKREFDGVIKTNFWGNDTPKENMLYTCIACINIDSVMRMDKKNHLQVYLDKCKYRIKKMKMSRFINTELKSDSDSELESDSELYSEAESKSNTKLMANLKSDSDSE